MKSLKASIYQTSPYATDYFPKSEVQVRPIDFNRVIHVINKERKKLFSLNKKKKDSSLFSEKPQILTDTVRNKFITNINMTAGNPRVTNDEPSEEYLTQKINNFTPSPQHFRVSFPKRRDFSKKNSKSKLNADPENVVGNSFVSSISQLESAFASNTQTPSHKCRATHYEIPHTEYKESRDNLNYYKIEQILGKFSKHKKHMIREIGRFQENGQGIPKTDLITTVDEYLKMNPKRIPFRQTNNLICKPMSAEKRKKKDNSKKRKLVYMSRGQNHS